MTEIQTIIEGGSIGICAFTLGILLWTIKKCLCISGNHIKHNTETQTKLIEKIKQDIDVGRETLQVLRSLNGHK